MGLRPDEREDFARQLAAAPTPSHKEEILRRAAGFGPGEAMAVMQAMEARAARGGDQGPPAAPMPAKQPQRPAMVEMKPEDRARAAAERVFAADADQPPAADRAAPPPVAPQQPPAKPLNADAILGPGQIARQPVPPAPPVAEQDAPGPQDAPEPEAPAAKTAAQNRRDAHLQSKFARDLVVRYAHLLPPGPNNKPNPYAAAIEEAGRLPGGMNQLRQFAQALRTQDLQNRRLGAKQRANDYNLSRDANNPNIAPGMRIRSLMAAVDANNPMQAAAVHEIAGNPMGAARATNVQITRDAGQAQVAAAQAGAAGKADPADTPQKPRAEQLSAEMQAALNIPQPDLRFKAVVNVLAALPENQGVPRPQIEAMANEAIAAHVFPQNAADPAVQAHLNTLRRDKAAYIDFAVRRLGMTQQQAELMYNSAQPTPQQQGQAAAQGVQDWARGVGNWATGFWQGVTGAAPPKPQG